MITWQRKSRSKKDKDAKKLFIFFGLALAGVVAVAGYQMTIGGETEEGPFKPSLFSELDFVGLDLFLAPVIDGRKISKYVTVGVTLAVYNEDYKLLIYKYITPLRYAFIKDFVFQAQMNSGTTELILLQRVKTYFCNLGARISGESVARKCRLETLWTGASKP